LSSAEAVRMDRTATETDSDLLTKLTGLPDIERPMLSPDGRWLAWGWSGLGSHSAIYLMPADGSAPPRCRLAGDEDYGIADWSADSENLLIAGTQDGDEKIRLYLLPRDAGEALLLTDAAPDYYIHGGRLDPAGRYLIYGANLDASRNAAIEASWIYRQELATGERRALARPVRANRAVPTVNAQGTHVLYTRNDRHPAGRQLWLVDIEGRADREILDAGESREVRASWSPDGQRELLLAETDTHWRVGLWHLEDARLQWVIDDPARTIEAVHWPRRSAEIVVIEVAEARSRASLLDPATGAERPVSGFGGTLLPLGPEASGRWIGRYYDARHPDRLVRLDPASRDVWPEPLFLPPPSHRIDAQALAPAHDFRWRSVDGQEIQGWLYRPKARPRGAVLVVHGGPTWHSENACDPLIQYLVANGFAVLDPNYRGSTGFGLGFERAIKREGWGGIEQDDIRAGIEALIAAGVAEPGRVGITGVSYGGYSSWCAITRLPRRLCAAAAPVCGMTDLVVDYETTRPDLRIYSEEMMGGSPGEVPSRYRDRSPIHFVDRIQGALLVVQGLQDPNVTPENMRAVEAALKLHAVAYELLTFADEGHGIHKPANRAVLYRRLGEFFARSLAERPA
jgi:dipeptidyl aminopeptidase/acylaminoacyl peptidase